MPGTTDEHEAIYLPPLDQLLTGTERLMLV